VEVLAQAGLGDLDGVLVEPLAVVVVHQAVVVDPVDLVDPEALHGVDVLAALGVAQANALNDPGEVAQVEDVVGLGGRGQKVLHGAFVDGQGGGDDLGDDLLEGVVEVLGRDVPIQDLGEDGGHGGVIELVDGDEVEVAEEARRDVVASAAWWAHGAHELYVGEGDLGLVFSVVPVPVVEPLAEELDGRLGSVRLYLRHVDVVLKHY